MIVITVYNNYYKDEQMRKFEIANVTQAKEVLNNLLSGTEFDILVTHKEQ